VKKQKCLPTQPTHVMGGSTYDQRRRGHILKRGPYAPGKCDTKLLLSHLSQFCLSTNFLLFHTQHHKKVSLHFHLFQLYYFNYSLSLTLFNSKDTWWFRKSPLPHEIKRCTHFLMLIFNYYPLFVSYVRFLYLL